MKLVTGANGFLGRAVVAALRENRIPVRGAVRLSSQQGDVVIGEIGRDTNWKNVLEGVDTVIHTAARVHVMKDSTKDPLCEFRKVNFEGTKNIIKCCRTEQIKVGYSINSTLCLIAE